MVKKLGFLYFILFLIPAFISGQSFDRLRELSRERESLQATYDKINTQVKLSKNRKPSVELQDALDKLMAKDAEILNEITVVEGSVKKDLELAQKKEKPRFVKLNDKGQLLLIDSLSVVISDMQARQDSLLSGAASSNSYVQSLQNELRATANEKGTIQAELDRIKTDKFILARRNMILLYFNVGVAILLFSALIYQLSTLRRRKRKVQADALVQTMKPRPVTGFSTATGRVAMDAYDGKLEKIEMLGKLRERGLLTEEEFNLQKQQLLQHKNQ